MKHMMSDPCLTQAWLRQIFPSKFFLEQMWLEGNATGNKEQVRRGPVSLQLCRAGP